MLVKKQLLIFLSVIAALFALLFGYLFMEWVQQANIGEGISFNEEEGVVYSRDALLAWGFLTVFFISIFILCIYKINKL